MGLFESWSTVKNTMVKTLATVVELTEPIIQKASQLHLQRVDPETIKVHMKYLQDCSGELFSGIADWERHGSSLVLGREARHAVDHFQEEVDSLTSFPLHVGAVETMEDDVFVRISVIILIFRSMVMHVDIILREMLRSVGNSEELW